MNVWAIDKDLPLKHFLFELVHRYGENTFSLVKSSEHFQAAEIYKIGEPEIRAYIYTFAQHKDRYAIDLIYPLSQYNIIGVNENLTLEQLLSICRTHFDLSD